MKLKKIYEEKYKKLLLIPILLLIFALIQIALQYATTGDFVNRGITLKGGATITIEGETGMTPQEIQRFLTDKFPISDISVRTLSSAGSAIGEIIELDTQERSEIDSVIAVLKDRLDLSNDSYSIEIVGSALGKGFFIQSLIALLIAFGLMGIVVFLYFRRAVTSLTIILAAASDIIVTLAIFNLTGIKLSSAGVAAFLMLIGYSVDSDILLSTRVIKRNDGPVTERVYGAMKTGLTMSATTLAAVLISMVFIQNDTIKQIMVILFIGLLVDLIMTYIQNVGILRWELEHKQK
ncbi:MAG TPA: protein translocase subunit SecF [Candidatus Nanoarchaeia archaeon]|nr:protein translocase subunit SecF [Candidatus Nanoarchaeia archaeon]